MYCTKIDKFWKILVFESIFITHQGKDQV